MFSSDHGDEQGNRFCHATLVFPICSGWTDENGASDDYGLKDEIADVSATGVGRSSLVYPEISDGCTHAYSCHMPDLTNSRDRYEGFATLNSDEKVIGLRYESE